MPQEYYQAAEAAKRSTWLLFAVFVVLILLIGWFFGYWLGSEILGTLFAIVIAVVWGAISWYAGDRVILAVSGAKEVQKAEQPYLFNVTEGLALAAGVPMPRLYLIDDPSPNAFATGRDPAHSSIAVTTGLLKLMDRQELEGVVAHEMSHIRNYDIRTMMVAAVLVGVIALLGNMFIRMMGRNSGGRKGGAGALMLLGIVFIALSPFVAQLIKLAISRSREYLADASAVELTRQPDGLMRALQKLQADNTPLRNANSATAHLYIEDPFQKESGWFAALGNMFSTHPPLPERIKKLRDFGTIG
jgi:heat shock protein HtpX